MKNFRFFCTACAGCAWRHWKISFFFFFWPPFFRKKKRRRCDRRGVFLFQFLPRLLFSIFFHLFHARINTQTQAPTPTTTTTTHPHNTISWISPSREWVHQQLLEAEPPREQRRNLARKFFVCCVGWWWWNVCFRSWVWWWCELLSLSLISLPLAIYTSSEFMWLCFVCVRALKNRIVSFCVFVSFLKSSSVVSEKPSVSEWILTLSTVTALGLEKWFLPSHRSSWESLMCVFVFLVRSGERCACECACFRVCHTTPTFLWW